ncbi:hypothetical protein [Salipaludibacillus sp. CF4.18]|uniref:hypothetical protein n=1 Tax=Salipaludibacillus sp. CF4.18 TaxID=3373081 RepID=UPI003EE7048A
MSLNFKGNGVNPPIGGKEDTTKASSRERSVGSSISEAGLSYNQRIAGSRNKRPQRINYDLIKQQEDKQMTKENKHEQAKFEVEKHEAHIEMLISVHKEVSDDLNWNEIVHSPRPFDVKEHGPHVTEINRFIEEYKATWRDNFFNRAEARIRKWKESIPQAQEKDQELIDDWDKDILIAKKIVLGDVIAMEEALENINPFEEIFQLGSSINFGIHKTGDKAVIKLQVQNKEAIPETTLSLTKTGKLSKRAIPKGKYFQLYQDYVCSCVLRIAREFFALLPIQLVQVNVYDDSFVDNSEDYGCILSVKMSRDDIKATNFDNIDCSDTIESFHHNMKFLKTKGFKFVEEVE